MKVKFVKYHENARMPEKAHEGDYGYDVYAVSEEEVYPGVWRYGLGFGLQPVRDEQIIDVTKSVLSTPEENSDIYFPNYIDLRTSPLNICISAKPRSSIYKTGMVLANSVPTIE